MNTSARTTQYFKQSCLLLICAMGVLGFQQCHAQNDVAACEKINNSFETVGTVEFEEFQGEPSIVLKKGDGLNLVLWLFKIDTSLSRIRLNFDENTKTLTAANEIGEVLTEDGTKRRAELNNGSCENGIIVFQEEKRGQSDGSPYQLHATTSFFVDSDGVLNVEWDVNTRGRILIFGTGTTNKHGMAKFRMLY